MKATLEEWKSILGSLLKLNHVGLPIQTATWVESDLRKIEPVVEHLKQEHIALIEKHGVLQKDGSSKVPPENNEAFFAEYNQLIKTEKEIEVRHYKLSVLAKARLQQGKGEQTESILSPEDIRVLKGMLIFDFDKDELNPNLKLIKN